MKKMKKIKKIILPLIFCLLALNLLSSEKPQIFSFGFIGALTQDDPATMSDSGGYWGFGDMDSSEINSLDGYILGTSFDVRISKYISIFSDYMFSDSSILLGRKGHRLKGIAIITADPNYNDSISQPLPNDIYYISKAFILRFGIKLYYPSKYIEPYFAIAPGITYYQIYFGDKNTTINSDIISDIGTIFCSIFGTNFNLYLDNKKLLTFSIFFEPGGKSVTDVSTPITNWIWLNWTYQNQFVIVPLYRFGFSVTSYFF